MQGNNSKVHVGKIIKTHEPKLTTARIVGPAKVSNWHLHM